VPVGDDRLWRSAGFEVLEYHADGDPDASAGQLRPVLRRLAEPPVLRWAIKTARTGGGDRRPRGGRPGERGP
jgi:hypothetical protein